MTGNGINPSNRSGRVSSSAGKANVGICLIEGARAEGEKQGYGPTITYRRQDITVGTRRHWQLVERACRAEFAQNPEAAEALLATGQRPLTHVVRRDSTTIPGVNMAAIWMRIGKDLTNAAPVT